MILHVNTIIFYYLNFFGLVFTLYPIDSFSLPDNPWSLPGTTSHEKARILHSKIHVALLKEERSLIRARFVRVLHDQQLHIKLKVFFPLYIIDLCCC